MKNWIIVCEKTSLATELLQCEFDFECVELQNINTQTVQSKNIIYVGNTDYCAFPKNGYRIKSLKTKYDTQVIILSGCDEINTAYAVVTFTQEFLVEALNAHKHNGPYFFNRLFTDPMPEYDKSFTPAIKNRAIWTWGYVIYDYRKFIDNMLKLRLNMLVIWNDYPPENAKEVVEYAHKNGIKIIWGFAWGWGVDCSKIDVQNLDTISEDVINKYKNDYAHLDGDGVYFQSFTELETEKIGDIVIAEAVTELVNKIADKLLKLYPDLYLQFGLHATSVKDKLDYIKNVDPRVTIFWEDCGAFPYHYIPKNTEGFEETVNFTEKIKNLRDGGFGTLFKGMTCLDWTTFKHQEDTFVLGECSEEFINRRTAEKEKIWKYLQAYWITNAHYVKELLEKLDSDTLVGALIEDGMLESGLWYPAALYAQMLWDNESTSEELLNKVALMPQVKFAN